MTSSEQRISAISLPMSISRGSFRAEDFYLTHAIWRNSYGSSQPETGVRTVSGGKVNDDFQLIEHGCPDFEWASPLILRLLRSGRATHRVGEIVGWLWQRRRRSQARTAWATIHEQTIDALTASEGNQP